MTARQIVDNVVWAVRGHTGEYSDRAEWVVCAYLSEEKARAHAEAADAWAMALYERSKTAGSDQWNVRREADKNPYDSRCHMDYNGTRYTYEMIEIMD